MYMPVSGGCYGWMALAWERVPQSLRACWERRWGSSLRGIQLDLQEDHLLLFICIRSLPFSQARAHLFLLVSAGWLDDIGLPQYKDQFHESRVDGRMLQYLTVVRIFPFSVDCPCEPQLRYPQPRFHLLPPIPEVFKWYCWSHKRSEVAA